MTRETFTIAAVAFLCIASAAPEVIFVSPCECQGFHGKNRWITKTDLSPVPSDKSLIQSVTPSQIYAWAGPGPRKGGAGYGIARPGVARKAGKMGGGCSFGRPAFSEM
jgi:hypothetical protein